MREITRRGTEGTYKHDKYLNLTTIAIINKTESNDIWIKKGNRQRGILKVRGYWERMAIKRTGRAASARALMNKAGRSPPLASPSRAWGCRSPGCLLNVSLPRFIESYLADSLGCLGSVSLIWLTRIWLVRLLASSVFLSPGLIDFYLADSRGWIWNWFSRSWLTFEEFTHLVLLWPGWLLLGWFT